MINYEEDRKESLGEVDNAKALSDQVTKLQVLEDEIVEGLELQLPHRVLTERRVRLDVNREQVLRQLQRFIAGAALPEEAGDRAPRAELGDDRALARSGRAQAERARHARLSDATLAGDDQEALV